MITRRTKHPRHRDDTDDCRYGLDEHRDREAAATPPQRLPVRFPGPIINRTAEIPGKTIAMVSAKKPKPGP